MLRTILRASALLLTVTLGPAACHATTSDAGPHVATATASTRTAKRAGPTEVASNVRRGPTSPARNQSPHAALAGEPNHKSPTEAPQATPAPANSSEQATSQPAPESPANAAAAEQGDESQAAASAGHDTNPLPFKPGATVKLHVKGDRPIYVTHAAAGNRQAIVYLHGICGNIHAIDTWKHTAAQYGTLVVLLGDKRCKSIPGRFRWSHAIRYLERRIVHALSVVAKARGGRLDCDKVTLFGYSQGAARAQELAAKFPQRYPRVILGGAPMALSPQALRGASAVSVLGGELENTKRMRAGADALAQAGKRSRFFLFPKAKHGHFGPQGDAVMGKALAWLFRSAPTKPSTISHSVRKD